ncbi:Cellulose_synt domain-containing protein, partial [Cephalotus follicularis]
WLLVFVSELLLSFIWLLGQVYRWRPVSRTVFTERLPADDKLPAIDVFVCTADPEKEPTVHVMNTVLSAMALDYPPEKLHVYLSDDGGAAITLLGMKEAWKFARWWLPFCSKYSVKTLSPEAYFRGMEDDDDVDILTYPEFMSDKQKIKKVLERFGMKKSKLVSTPLAGHFKLSDSLSPKTEVEVKHMSRVPYVSAVGSLMYAMVCTMPDISHAVSVVCRYMVNPGEAHWDTVKWIMRYLKVSTDIGLVYGSGGAASMNVVGYSDFDYAVKMPLLTYVSREKKPSYHHHFKAGALNVLVWVSGVLSNSPYILVLDCDMQCNDPTSARQAMCFHLDPKISSSLGFVQFPQKFNNISEDDIYDSQIRSLFLIAWYGADGLKGPILSGTNFYIKREALYGSSVKKGIDLTKIRSSFGLSNDFIRSLDRNYKPGIIDGNQCPSTVLQETEVLASCAYENHTQWGEEVGFRYQSVLEDYLTALNMHCQGWTSVYLDPPRPQFLGTSTTNLNDLLTQGTRWSCGLVDVFISRFCPLIYGPLKMSFLQSMCYAQLGISPICYCLPLWCFATIPQLCLLNGISLYPEVSSSFFKIYLFIFMSVITRQIYEVLITGGSMRIWKNEQRIWMIKSITCHLYGTLDSVAKKLGMREASFLPTNKVEDEEQVKRYQMGIFDFQTSTLLLAPLVTLVILNMVSFTWGFIRMVATRDWNQMFVQLFLSLYILITNYAIIEGMIFRKDKGRVPLSTTQLSIIISIAFVSLGSIILMY